MVVFIELCSSMLPCVLFHLLCCLCGSLCGVGQFWIWVCVKRSVFVSTPRNLDFGLFAIFFMLSFHNNTPKTSHQKCCGYCCWPPFSALLPQNIQTTEVLCRCTHLAPPTPASCIGSIWKPWKRSVVEGSILVLPFLFCGVQKHWTASGT